jgi:energy-coupling factor transport system substrate-specific component
VDNNFVLVLIVNAAIVLLSGLIAWRLPREPMRGKDDSRAWTVRDVVIVAVLAAMGAVILTGESYVYQLSLVIGGPLGSAIMQSAFSWPYFIAFMLVRKPFSCTAVAVLITLTEALLGNPAGIYTMGWGITQGLSCDAVLAFTGWNSKNKWVFWLAAAVNGQFGTVWSWYLYGWGASMAMYWLSIPFTYIPGGFLSGFAGYYLGKALVGSGLVRSAQAGPAEIT